MLESEPAPKEVDPLMGWTSSRDTMQQVQLHFATLDEAKAYAEKNGWQYTVEQPHVRASQTQGLRRQFRLQSRRPLDALKGAAATGGRPSLCEGLVRAARVILRPGARSSGD